MNRAKNAGLVRAYGGKALHIAAEEEKANYFISEKGGLILNDDNDEARRFVERCFRTSKTMINPIIDWTEREVWDFLHHYGCESNPIYQCGERRVGCIGCPMATKNKRLLEFQRYPKYKENYIRSFDRMIAARNADGKKTEWRSGEECFSWWVGEDPNQLSMFDEEQEKILEDM